MHRRFLEAALAGGRRWQDILWFGERSVGPRLLGVNPET
jgi:hypothetical protein